MNTPKKYAATVSHYQTAFKTEAGKRVMADLMYRCHMMSSTFNHKEPEATYFKEGQRSVVVRILGILEEDPNKLIKQIEESEEYMKEEGYDV